MQPGRENVTAPDHAFVYVYPDKYTESVRPPLWVLVRYFLGGLEGVPNSSWPHFVALALILSQRSVGVGAAGVGAHGSLVQPGHPPEQSVPLMKVATAYGS